MKKKSLRNFVSMTSVALILLVGLMQCASKSVVQNNSHHVSDIVDNNILKSLPWSERMAQSIMKRADKAWKNDFQEQPVWTYTIGLIMNSICKVGKEKNKPKYIEYAKGYADTMIEEDGRIKTYDIASFNIDNIAPGPYLWEMYELTGEKRYKKAIQTLMRQLRWQPQTTDGGYWHKLRYPWQMWLDGLFMGEPFQAQCAMKFNKPELYDHIIHQFELVEIHTKDNETGLLYHGWDESRVQRWSDPKTGCSSHFWGRGIGWYCMGLVDVLDYIPNEHPKRSILIAILNRTIDDILKYKDPQTNTWWQVVNMPNRAGNYLEATASSMFTYAMIKGVNNGYLAEHYRAIAEDCYQGIINTFIKVDNDGEVHLTKCCSVAGLGGNPYRDGSYDYYINEPIRANDPKGIGPFMLASLEIEK